MPTQILMPALSPTMTEGNLAKWLKHEGDEVHSGDVVAEIETDKATMEVEAADEGRIGKLLVPEGAQGIKVNQPIAVLLEEGEDASALDELRPPPQTRGNGSSDTEPAPHPDPLPASGAREQSPAGAQAAEGRIFASPLARRMAQQAGLDLAALKGSGPQGRIVKADIEAALKPGRAPQAEAPRPLQPAAAPALSKERVATLAGNAPYTERPLSAMRRTIARRLTEAKQTVPHFYLTVDCEIDALLKIRSELNSKIAPTSSSPASGGGKGGGISLNDFVIRAAALALRKVPAANASWSDEAILQWDTVDISVAVALEDGLITPIVKQADRKGLATIAAETKDLVARARAGKLKLEEFQGGTFSVSNLGMYGVRDFAAVINPPHGGILAVGAGEQRPVVRNGRLAVATVMSCTLSCDHRAVDGAVGAQFLAAFKRLVEDPLTMLL
ncbi:MAG TPA: pyruvate dehydrogenase complex dihydrolipoamide acetyltransferase [Stellaceae bacterium]|jgi:pyruvate dehydrogenase E2 component (dihydrolipoamide acetyltransferase)|nr:pyruvate dehydrogenase complex dihydrolipoamide acetyltransferase [Stellaceae bacterium]